MALMKVDMGGGAAVIGIFEAISQLKLKQNVIGLIPCVENMPSGNSFKPGDVITAFNGMTKVDNTDAEGRLILPMHFLTLQNSPEICNWYGGTLTGASIVYNRKRGFHCYGKWSKTYWYKLFWSRRGRLMTSMAATAFGMNMTEWFSSEIADVKNTGQSRQAGTIMEECSFKDSWEIILESYWHSRYRMRDESDYDPKRMQQLRCRELVTQFLMNESK